MIFEKKNLYKFIMQNWAFGDYDIPEIWYFDFKDLEMRRNWPKFEGCDWKESKVLFREHAADFSLPSGTILNYFLAFGKKKKMVLLAGAVEYTDCISVDG